MIKHWILKSLDQISDAHRSKKVINLSQCFQNASYEILHEIMSFFVQSFLPQISRFSFFLEL